MRLDIARFDSEGFTTFRAMHAYSKEYCTFWGPASTQSVKITCEHASKPAMGLRACMHARMYIDGKLCQHLGYPRINLSCELFIKSGIYSTKYMTEHLKGVKKLHQLKIKEKTGVMKTDCFI